MKILLDMNLSPEMVHEFHKFNIESVHWSTVGRYDAPDNEIIRWANENKYIVFTHDLDFGTALALTNANGPSVVQVRTQQLSVANLSKLLIPTLLRYENLLEAGSLLVIDEEKARIRILPLR